MIQRFLFVLYVLMSSISSVYAANCLDVFPSGWRQLAPGNEQLSNFPVNHSATTLVDGTTLPRGDSFYLNETLSNQDEVFIGPATASETTARLFFRGAVSWQNVKINETGNPEDLIIVIDGSLQVVGGNTVINAIIFVKGAVTVNGNPTINGAVGAVGSADNFTVNYNENNITNADFNGMCDPKAVLLVHYQFNEGSGQTTLDSTASGITGILGSSIDVDSNDPTWVCEANGYYLDFDRSNNQDVRTPSFTPPSEGSFAFWLKVPAAPISRQRIFGFGDGFEIRWEANDIMYFDINKTGSNTSIRSSSAITATDTWVHIAFVTSVDNGTWALYIDGELDNSGSESLSIQPASSLTLGGSTWKLNGEHYSGSLEDFRIYSGKLTPTEIEVLFESTKPEICNPFAAWWQFENNFLDSSSSDTHNLIPSNSPLFGFSDPGPANTVGNESTCSYVSFDGSNYASIDDSGDFNFQDLSVSTWVYPTSYPRSGLRSLVSKDEHFEFHINTRGQLYWWWRTPGGRSHTLTSSASLPLNVWTHVAVVYDSIGKQYMYINGELAKSASFADGLANTPCDFYIGTDVGTGSSTSCGGVISSRNFQGHMDEVHIYDSVLTESEIQDDLNVVHSCSLFEVDHYQIEHDGQGLTCEAENITIKACADNTCSTLHEGEIEVQLSINGTQDKTVTVSGGSTNTSFSYTNAITPATLSLDENYECKNGGSDSCDVEFDDIGFIFGNENSQVPVIPTQLSGKPSNTGFNSETLFLQAVKTDDNTGSCVGIFPDGADVPVNLSYTCHPDSSNCTSDLVLTNNSTGIGLTTDIVEHNLLFDTDSKSFFSLNYPDAGKLIVNAQKSIDVDGLTKNFSQSSNAFVVKPFGIKLDFTQDSNNGNAFALDEDESVFKKAGESFKVRATAVQWVSGEDVNADGIPDDLTSLNDNTMAKNFSGDTLRISPMLVLPNPGTIGALTSESSGSFADSTIVNNYNYDEVGIINLAAALGDGDYLLAGNVYGQINNVGRFTPDYFVVSSPFVGNSCGNITYMDEHAIKLTYEIEARNSTHSITQNYTGVFAKSSVVLVAENSSDGIDLAPARLTGSEGSWSSGIYINEVDNQPDIDVVTFIRDPTPVVDGPFDNLLFGVKLTGTEGAGLIDLDMRSDTTGICTTAVDSATDCTAKLLSSTESKIRFGRWVIDNTFGPETSDLAMPMYIQYYNGSRFVINTLDSCTAFDGNDDANFTLSINDLNEPLSSVLLTPVSGSGTFALGLADLQISKPSDGSRGQIQLIYDDTPAWLRYDWSWNGVDAKEFDENPSATATFGIFRGNDRIIYQREVNN